MLGKRYRKLCKKLGLSHASCDLVLAMEEKKSRKRYRKLCKKEAKREWLRDYHAAQEGSGCHDEGVVNDPIHGAGRREWRA